MEADGFVHASLGQLPEFSHHLSVASESLPFPHPPLSTAPHFRSAVLVSTAVFSPLPIFFLPWTLILSGQIG